MRSSSLRWCGVLGACLGCLMLMSGCGGGASYDGPERAAVSGQVTLDGTPLPFGSISFMGAEGGRNASTGIANGQYSIPAESGPNLGKYRVTILGYQQAPPEDAGDEASAGQQVVPPQYNANTTLEVQITAGENTHSFALTTN
jgi:hypothetical protein